MRALLTRPRIAAFAAIAAVMAAAGLLTVSDARPAASQAVVLEAAKVKAPVALDDPLAPVWEEARPIEVAMTAQNVAPPKGGMARTLTARALYDDEKLYVLVEWEDGTQDLDINSIAAFTDAAAIEFPVAGGDRVPSFCMGDPNAPVNIWQWKATWQNDIVNGFQDVQHANPNMAVDDYQLAGDPVFYPAQAVGNDLAQQQRTTAAQNLVASSFGTLETDADQRSVEAWGTWADGRWRVIFARDLRGGAGLPSFSAEQTTSIAFAAWDGSNNDRNGQKSVGQFVELQLLAVTGAQERWPWVVAALAGAFVIVVGGAYLLDRLTKRRAAA